MHDKAKQRIAETKKEADARPDLLTKLPKKGKLYNNIKDAIGRLCDEALQKNELTDEERNKLAWLRSRVEIEM